MSTIKELDKLTKLDTDFFEKTFTKCERERKLVISRRQRAERIAARELKKQQESQQKANLAWEKIKAKLGA